LEKYPWGSLNIKTWRIVIGITKVSVNHKISNISVCVIDTRSKERTSISQRPLFHNLCSTQAHPPLIRFEVLYFSQQTHEVAPHAGKRDPKPNHKGKIVCSVWQGWQKKKKTP
jgi:hypothetical protein